MSKLVIAIDGPAGAGKTTVAKRVAADLGLRFLDTGAMYRCVALACERQGIPSSDSEGAAAVAARIRIGFESGEPQRVLLDGEDVTEAIRRPEMGDFASAVSVHSEVRRQLVRQQQEIVAAGGVILEGRDTTTVVAPHAQVKVYMTASVDTRAERRFRELREKGMPVDLNALKQQIQERDLRDSTRADSPLSVAEDAHVIDTDNMTIDEVVAELDRFAKCCSEPNT